jgi:hypothetical protein
MNLEEFWNIVEEANRTAPKTAEIPEVLVTRLSAISESDIIQFGCRFRECLDGSFDASLWLGAVVILGGCGDDTFSDFRAWLIAQGREAFEAALANPDSLAELKNFDGTEGQPRLEKMAYVDKDAYLKRAGSDDFETVCNYEALLPKRVHPTLKNRDLTNTSYEQAKALLPRLAARFPASIR